jgi:hypothetical protein
MVNPRIRDINLIMDGLPRPILDEVLAFVQQKAAEDAQAKHRSEVSLEQMDANTYVEADMALLESLFFINDDKLAWYRLHDLSGVFAYVATEEDAALMQRLYRVIKNCHPVTGKPMPDGYDDVVLLSRIIGDFK